MAGTGTNQNATDTIMQNNADGGSIGMGLQFSRSFRWLGADILVQGNGAAIVTFPTGTSTLLSTQLGEFTSLLPQLTSATGTSVIVVENSQDSNKKYYMQLADMMASPLLSNGTYTPTVTSGTNLKGATVVSNWVFWRIGNLVMVQGAFAMSAVTSGSSTIIEFSLPVLASFVNQHDCVGWAGETLSAQGNGIMGTVVADTTKELAEFVSFPTNLTLLNYRIAFTYLIR